MPIDLQQFIGEFTKEAREHVQMISNSLVNLETFPDDLELLDQVFRSAHSIKGTARMLKLLAISDLSHKMENIFDAFRSKKIQVSSNIIDLLLKAIDIVSEMLDQADEGVEIAPIEGGIIDDLISAADGNYRSLSTTEVAASETTDTKKSQELSQSETAPRDAQKETALSEKIELDSQPEQSPQSPAPQENKDLIKKTPPHPEKPKPTILKKGAESIRISPERLDDVIKLMGEIVSNQNRLKHRMFEIRDLEKSSKKLLDTLPRSDKGNLPTGMENEQIHTAIEFLYQNLTQLASDVRNDVNIQELLTNELQNKALKLRMMPLSTVFDTFQRTVRDLSRSLSKEITFSVSGGETELDKKVVEQLGDPLMHMIRNAIDHGIEPSRDRQKAGKPAKGTVGLSAYYEGRTVLIRLQDDGQGISLEKLREKALEKGLFDQETLENMSDHEIIDLIFHPGFSTSENVTEMSGRGVGMDVVKKNIMLDMKGSIQIETKLGAGTTFLIYLPLTLSILNVLLVKTANMIFALFSSSVDEIIRTSKSELISVLNCEAISLRNQLIPIVRLDQILQTPDVLPMNLSTYLIIIVHVGQERLGLIVDSLLSAEDIVIKPLPHHMKDNEWVTGVAITGKNELVNVLHIPTILMNANKNTGIKNDFNQLRISQDESLKILLVDCSSNIREMEKSILEKNGYTVHTADDGREGLKKAREYPYDLIITDVEMPNMDGFSLTENLRQEAYYKNTPIIIATSLDKKEHRRKGLQVGADAYILKNSLDQSTLLEAVESLIV